MTSSLTKWKTAPLGDWPIEYIDGDRSSRYPKRSEYVSQGVPFLNGTCISDGTIDEEHLNFITEEKAASIRKGRALPLDLLMTTRGNSVGNVSLFPEKLRWGLINAQMLIVRADATQLDPLFLFQAIRSPGFQKSIKSFASGSAQPQIPIRDLKHIPFSAPPFPTQRRIASILSAYDNLIENNTRRIAILEEMARRLYEEWFIHFRFPGWEKARKDRKLPSGWEERRLGDLVDDIRDTVHPSCVPAETSYVGLEHIPRRSITLGEWSTASTVDSNKLRFRRGDILFGKIRPYFHKVSVAPIEGICSSDTILMRPKLQRFFALALCCSSSDKFIDHATQTSNGTKMPRANWKVLKDYPVLLPDEDLLSSFNGFVERNVEQTRCLMLKNANLRTQRDLLLPKLVSGEIDVSDIPAPGEVAA